MSKWKIIVSHDADKQLGNLKPKEREKVLDKIDELEDGPYHPDAQRLHGRPEWRLRVGRLRVLFTVHKEIITIKVVSVGSRGDIYK